MKHLIVFYFLFAYGLFANEPIIFYSSIIYVILFIGSFKRLLNKISKEQEENKEQ